jgi:hypothetical protein
MSRFDQPRHGTEKRKAVVDSYLFLAVTLVVLRRLI